MVIIVDNNGNYFEGHSKWTKNQRKANIYKNRKTAIRHYFSNKNKYKNLYTVEVLFQEIESPKLIEEKDYIECNNLDYIYAKERDEVV